MVSLQTVIFSQPPVICDNPPKMTSFCKDACIICDIDGYTGRHNSNVTGWLPPDFCTTTVHNAQWIAFIAGSTNLRIELTVTNCSSSQGWGLEMTVYETRDCNTFQKVFDCDGDVEENTRRVFTNTKPLTIGQYYYLVMDGNGGDNCDWTFKVLEGTTEVSPLETSGELSIPDVICANTDVELLLNAPVGATEFYWTIDDAALNINKSKFEYQFTQNGEYNVCVSAANACDNAPPVCKKTLVVSTPPESYESLLCGTDCFILPDTTLCEEGFHQLIYQSKDGCDSIINVFIEVRFQPVTNLKATICSGDTIYVDELPFTASNLFQVNIDRQYCDSIVNLDLKVIECNINGTSLITDASCYEFDDGVIDFTIQNGTPPFTYAVKDLSGAILDTGSVPSLNLPIKVQGFKAGFYLVEVKDNFGNSEILLNEVFEPTALVNSSTLSNYNLYNVSCFGGDDGFITINPSGGTEKYNFLWSNGETTNPAQNLKAGYHTLTITDANGCLLIQEYELSSPDEIQFDVEIKNPECYIPKTGIINLTNQVGGVTPFNYSLNNNSFQEEQRFNELLAGEYTVYIKDTNGCVTSKTVSLFDPEIPEITLPDELELELGDSIQLLAYSNLQQHKLINWNGKYSFNCDTCLETYYFPFKDNYAALRLISKDDCEDIDSVFVSVINKRHVYTANIFNSNSTINNEFALVLGKGIKDVIQFDIYDRWGNLVHKESHVSPGNHTGWDGKLNGKECEIGVYVWMAEIRYLDDTTEFFKGDITLIK